MNYTVVLVDSVLGVIVEQVEVGSDSCEDDICSTFLSPSPSNQTYTLTVNAINIQGPSSPTVFDDIVGKLKVANIVTN